jgi:putative phage-type endonuclease
MGRAKKKALPAVIDRKTFIGSSDIAAIAGLSPWKTPFDCFVEKCGLVEEGPKPTGIGRDPLYFGKLLERLICEEYARRENRNLVMLFDEPQVHPERRWHGGSPDAVDYAAGVVVDAKNVGMNAARGFGESGSDEFPDYYLVQLAWLQSLLNVEGADLAVLLGGQELRVFSISRNRDLEDVLLNIAERFWTNHVEKGVPPPVTDSETARAYFRSRFPQEIEAIRDATPEEATLAAQLAHVRAEFDLIEKAKADLEARLKLSIGDAAGLRGDGFGITWKKAKDGVSVDWQAAFTAARNELALLAASGAGPLVAETAKDVCSDAFLTPFTTPKPGARRFLPRFEQHLLKGETNAQD